MEDTNKVVTLPKYTPEFKIVLVGDYGVGKSAYAQRFRPMQQKQQSIAPGAHKNTILFNTNFGPVKIHLCDTSGQQKLGGLGDDYYLAAQAAILMFDTGSRMTYKNVPKWYQQITRVCENIPMVLVGNKVDKKEQFKKKFVTFHRKTHMQYYDIFALGNFQVEKPILWILRKLTGCIDLMFAQELPLQPSSLTFEQKTNEVNKDQEGIVIEEDQDNDL